MVTIPFKLEMNYETLKALAALNVDGAEEMVKKYQDTTYQFVTILTDVGSTLRYLTKHVLNDEILNSGSEIYDAQEERFVRHKERVSNNIKTIIDEDFKEFIWKHIPITVYENFLKIGQKLEFIQNHFEQCMHPESKEEKFNNYKNGYLKEMYEAYEMVFDYYKSGHTAQ